MKVIFRAKTNEGYVLKILAELLQNNIKTASFVISQSGMTLRMMDSLKTILIDLELNSANFQIYKFENDTEIYVGLNLTHFHKMLKTIKKKDSVEFFISSSEPEDLGIKVIPKENNRITTSSIKIQNIQNLDINLPEGYTNPVLVSSSDFQKMIKGLANVSKETHISSRGYLIKFLSEADGVYKRCTEFGEREEDEDSDDEKTIDYEDKFETEQLTRVTKIAGLSPTVQIYTKTDNPILFKTAVGSLGYLSIYLKSKSLQDNESRASQDN